MIIDCDRCAARGSGCEDCVVSVLLGPPQPVEFDPSERVALVRLAAAGLLPPLRLVDGSCPESARAQGCA